MSPHSSHHITRSEDRISPAQKIAFGTGQISNIILALAIANLAPFVLTVELQVDAFLVGLAMGLPRLWDAITDPIVGYMSDNWRSKWGRRKPFLLVGAISVGAVLALMWQLPRGWTEMQYFWFFFGMSLVFFLCYTIYATPYVAMSYELTPDYHERTRLMAWMNFMGGIASIAMPWAYNLTQRDWFDDGVQGARIVAIGMGALVILFALVPILFLKDPTKQRFQKRTAAESEAKPRLNFFSGLWMTLKNRNFRLLCFATFAFFPGLLMVNNFGAFLVIYYVYGGERGPASELMGWGGSLAAVLGLLFVPLVNWMSGHYGKRKAFLICAGFALFGTFIKYWCYNPEMPYVNLVPGPFIGLGFAALWILTASMMADVCDEDELHTGERREGTYSAVYWWIVKLGMSASLVIGGPLLNLTGFNEDLPTQAERTIFLMRIVDVAFPALFIALSIYFIYRFPITEERAYEIKAELEKKRGRLNLGEAN